MKKVLITLIIPFISFSQTPCLDEVANASGLIGEFIPQCEDDGSYSPLQCWSSTGYCWCVDENGIEIPGTILGPGQGLPQCEQIEGCTEFFAINFDPGATIDDGSCEFACDNLEISTINLIDNQVSITIQNIGLAGYPYPGLILFNSLGDTMAIENVNLFGIGDESIHILELTGATITSDISLQLHTGFYDLLVCEWIDISFNECTMSADPGICDGSFQAFYYNSETSTCQEFSWGGCGGIVPFWSIEDCQNSCENINIKEQNPIKKTIAIIDILGRETISKGFQLHIYDDGSVEKKYQLY